MKAKRTDMRWEAIYAMLVSVHIKHFIVTKYLNQLLKSTLQGTRSQDFLCMK